MKRTAWLQETRQMRFEEAYQGWTERRLTQEEAARLLGVCDRTFRRYIDRYEEQGLDGLIDRRLERVSHRRAPVDEVLALTQQYETRFLGWNIKHFHSWYRREGGQRSYTWVKNRLQEHELVAKGKARQPHRQRRPPSPLPGMMIHQDGSTHTWVPGVQWDLIATMDDATNEHYSLFLVEQEGTLSSFRGVREVIEARGLFSSFYSDRGSHYWFSPEAGGAVDKTRPTQFGRAMRQLGIEMIPAYSPEARGRSERAFRTHQGRLPRELAAAGITTLEAANSYLETVYRPAYNREFMRLARESGSAFVPLLGTPVADILCEQHERTVGKDNCVSFQRLTLQIPPDRHRMHYVKARVRVHRYPCGRLAIFHGPRQLASYDAKGRLLDSRNHRVAA